MDKPNKIHDEMAPGVQLSASGMIQQVNLTRKGQDLKNHLVNDKDALVAIFEDIFGNNEVN